MQNNKIQYINQKYEELTDYFGEETTNRLIYLYEFVSIVPLKKVFSLTHYQLNRLFQYVNSRISNGRITASESRALIFIIEKILNFEANLQESNYKFEINTNYRQKIMELRSFLQESYGSDIPEGFQKILIIESNPVFILTEGIQVNRSLEVIKTSLIGEGSYARVYKVIDKNYNVKFALKRAKENLTEKEYKRFEREYETIKNLNSPYIVEVYRFNNDKKEYLMEYVNLTLKKWLYAKICSCLKKNTKKHLYPLKLRVPPNNRARYTDAFPFYQGFTRFTRVKCM